MKKTKVYLAGKIKPHDWRHKFVNIRGEFMCWDVEEDPIWYDKELEFNEKIDIVGPWFISCDHSCYHGERSHGVGAWKHVACTGTDPIDDVFVSEICEIQIKKSDVVFAYIDDDTCFGSLWEIGYAYALKKKVILLFDTTKRQRDMWFISNCANISVSKEGLLSNEHHMLSHWTANKELSNVADDIITKLLMNKYNKTNVVWQKPKMKWN